MGGGGKGCKFVSFEGTRLGETKFTVFRTLRTCLYTSFNGHLIRVWSCGVVVKLHDMHSIASWYWFSWPPWT